MQARSCLYVSTRVRTHHFHKKKKEKKKREHYLCFKLFCVVLFRFNFYKSCPRNQFKIFYRICLKNRTQLVSQKFYQNQNTLRSATINPCHPDISFMTKPELRDTCLKNLLIGGVGGGGQIDYTRLFISSQARFKFLYIMCY